MEEKKNEKDPKKEILLKVAEIPSSVQSDIGINIVRIDSKKMEEIGIKEGDVVEIEGSRKTAAIALRAYPSDIGINIIRMDGITRRNAGTSIGEIVKVRKANVREAKEVVLAPAEKGIILHMPNEYVKRMLMNRVVTKGDIILPYNKRGARFFPPTRDDFFNFGLQEIQFKVVDTKPLGIVKITELTNVKILSKAVEVKEDEAVPSVSYEDIGGLSETIKKIREMIELPLKHPQLFERLGIEPPKGILLYGPPGTGKTMIAKAVANEAGTRFISINGPEITSKWYGESEKKIRDIFKEAEENAPAIIFIDEIDAIAPKREDVLGEVERRIVAQLLASMDGLKGRGQVVVIGATNRPDALDPALRRPGRFDREIEIGVPNKEGRKEILQIKTRNMPLYHWDDNIAFEVILSKVDNKRAINGLKRRFISLFSNVDSIDRMEILRRYYISVLDNIKEFVFIHHPDEDVEWKELEENIMKLESMINKEEYIDIMEDLIERDFPYLRKINDTYVIKFDKDRLLEISKSMGLNSKFIDKLSKLNEEDVESLFNLLKLFGKYEEEIIDKSVEEMIEELSRLTHGFVGADLEALVKEAAMNALRRLLEKVSPEEEISEEDISRLFVTYDDFKHALNYVEPSAMREVLVEVPNVTWDDIGGLEDVKQQLREMVEWPLKHPESFKRLGIEPPKGVLLYGLPGTGKTLLAKAVANESEANFIYIKGPEILNKWVGESEKRIRDVFKKAKQVAPAIIFIDEIDAIAPRRGLGIGNEVTDRIITQLLTELDGLEKLENVVVIAATNRPDIVDPALLRAGRFDRQIYIPVPDRETRLKILKVHTKNMPLSSDVNLEELADLTDGFVGADIANLCKEAGIIALRKSINTKEVTREDFMEALKVIKPSVDKETIERYKEKVEKMKKAALKSPAEIMGYVG